MTDKVRGVTTDKVRDVTTENVKDVQPMEGVLRQTRFGV
jgi:hypothetical protein